MSGPDPDPVVLVVDDLPANLRLMAAVLEPRGYEVVTATSGAEALQLLAARDVDLVLLDLLMPGMDGYEVCRSIRADERTAFLPVVMVTASEGQQKVRALEAGADDFVAKPFDSSELLARVRSLVRINRYHHTITEQAAQLAAWNRELEARVSSQVEQLQRADRLRRFLPPQVADMLLSSGSEEFLDGHRRDITVVFADLRGFTHFAETAEPEEVWTALRDYHAVLGALVQRFEGTLERFTGDGIMVFFNDPVPVDDAVQRAVAFAVAARDQVRTLAESWSSSGYDLALGLGVAQGYATLGRIGFEGRFDYAAIGTVCNLSARLCAAAGPWQVLVSPRVHTAVHSLASTRPVGELELKGLSRPVPTFDVLEMLAEADDRSR
jgi:class 3 adenylate cyclase